MESGRRKQEKLIFFVFGLSSYCSRGKTEWEKESGKTESAPRHEKVKGDGSTTA